MTYFYGYRNVEKIGYPLLKIYGAAQVFFSGNEAVGIEFVLWKGSYRITVERWGPDTFMLEFFTSRSEDGERVTYTFSRIRPVHQGRAIIEDLDRGIKEIVPLY